MTLKQTIATLCLVAFCGLGFSALAQGDDASPLAIESFPKTLDKNCGDGLARIYDECGDQSAILNAAVAAARAQNKSVLVVFGSEWCIWCHVFDSYIHGQRGMHDYKWRAEQDGELVHWPMQEMMDEDIRKDAVALNRYVAEHFVVAHIEAGADNGRQTLEQAGADTSTFYTIPAILRLDAQGRYTGRIPPSDLVEGLQVRESGGEEYRGYNRAVLLAQLQKLVAEKAKP